MLLMDLKLMVVVLRYHLRTISVPPAPHTALVLVPLGCLAKSMPLDKSVVNPSDDLKYVKTPWSYWDVVMG